MSLNYCIWGEQKQPKHKGNLGYIIMKQNTFSLEKALRKPWSLYLANGVLGLDFIFTSGLQINTETENIQVNSQQGLSFPVWTS